MLRTIKSASEIDSLFKTGTRAATSTCSVLVGCSPEGRGRDGRVVFVAGKRLGSAVLRNRCKRVMRASVMRIGGPWPGWDVAIMARRETPKARGSRLDADLCTALRKAGVLNEPSAE